MTKLEYLREPRPALWNAPAPSRFDAVCPWWMQICLGVAATVIAYVWMDKSVAAWAILHDPLVNLHQDATHELMMLEQYGQWVCSIIVIAAVALIDRHGRRNALAIGLGCLATVAACYILKDAIGRTRPGEAGLDGSWNFYGFAGHGSRDQSFPSAHTTGAMALSAGLAWCYPRGRGLFYALAVITAGQRILHHAHYVSDTIAATVLAITIVRATLHANLAGRLVACMPPKVRQWWLQDV
jgi:membrane-associated phospholipid phosphatase